MNWKNLKLKGKFGVAFGTIILLLIFVSFFAVKGIRGIIGNAEEVIDGNKLRALIVQKEVDHLNWASAVSDLLNNDDVTTLNVQTDPTKCGFGKWYYSEDRKMAEELVPELKEYLMAIEEPHNHLHESAIEIQNNYVEVDVALGTFLASKRADHIAWMNQARKEILGNKRNLSVQKDPHQCGLGKWMYSDEVREMAKTNKDLAEFLKNVEKPHNDLHSCAYTIDEYLQSNNINGAVTHLNNACEFNAQKVLDQLNHCIALNSEKVEQMNIARSIYSNQTLKDLNEIQGLLKKINETASNNIMTDDEMLNSASQTSSGVLIFSLVISILAVILAVVIASGIIKPINKGVAFARKLSEGDLTTTVDVNQKDEIGQLAKALNAMARRLREIVESILSGADNIASASQEMSSTSQEMSQGASEQASSVEEVSSSMEEMSANIDQNTDNARGTESIALKAAAGIKEGSEATNIAVDGMKNIAEKIRIVNDIAFQTNILALNAAVEAARAGEHGKGFAVVAAEVRKLAERSKIAAEEIDELSKNGVVAAENAGNKLIEIVPEIEKTAQLVQEIASASMEQSAGAEQVNNAMQQLNNVTQQNAAASEELATSSEELASQAEQLKETIRFFNIGHRSLSTAQKAKKTKTSSKVSDQESMSVKSSGKKINLETEKVHIDDNEFESY